MIVNQIYKSEFKKCESTTVNKVLINICDYLIYGLTDTNQFYRNLYTDPKNDYNNGPQHSLGDVFYSKILSYHTVANLVCVELPKSVSNLNPFKINHFKTCCSKLLEYIINNDVKEIHTPVFGTKILEGNWKDISNIMVECFNKNLERLVIYV